jgi:hypothetical protein
VNPKAQSPVLGGTVEERERLYKRAQLVADVLYSESESQLKIFASGKSQDLPGDQHQHYPEPYKLSFSKLVFADLNNVRNSIIIYTDGCINTKVVVIVCPAL